MSISSSLYRLQQIDSQIDQARNRLNQIDAILNDQTAVQNAESNFKTAQTALLKERKELTQLETQAKDQRIKIQLNESALYGGKVRNPKELQDLQNEIASLKKYLVVIEERQFDAMLLVEEAEAVFQKAEGERGQIEAQLIEQNANLRGERSSILLNMERLQVEREAAEKAIAPPELDIYLHLRKSRSGVAVTRIVDRTCSACGFSLPPALAQAASTPTQIVRCTSCSRILYNG